MQKARRFYKLTEKGIADFAISFICNQKAHEMFIGVEKKIINKHLMVDLALVVSSGSMCHTVDILRHGIAGSLT